MISWTTYNFAGFSIAFFEWRSAFNIDHVFDWTEKLFDEMQSEVNPTVPLTQRSQRAPNARMLGKGLR